MATLIPSRQYDGVLLGEGHDFKPEWLIMRHADASLLADKMRVAMNVLQTL